MEYEIRTLKDDEKITEPGFYNIPLERHHNQPCDGPSVTSGVLRKMELETPADVWAYSKLNPNRFEQEQTAAMRMGAAMAFFCEGGKERVLEHFNVHPAGKPRKPTQVQIDAYDKGEPTDAGKVSVEYWRAVEAHPSAWMDPSEMELIEAMGAALVADPVAMDLMSGIPECTMAYQDEITGLWLLARPDTVAFDGTSTDYKKINTQGRPFNHRVVDQRITQHGYDMQMAFASEIFERLTGIWPETVGIVAQWDKPPYHVILREIAEEDLRMAQWRNRRAINNFANCLQTNDWWGPGHDTAAYQRPDWQREYILQEMNMTGEAP